MLPTFPLSCVAPHYQHLDEALACGGGGDGGGGGGVAAATAAVLKESHRRALEEEMKERPATQEREAMAEAAEQLQRQMTEVL